MDIDGAHGLAVLLVTLAVPLVIFGGRLLRGARSHSGRAVAVTTAVFGVALLALIVPALAAKLFGAAALAV